MASLNRSGSLSIGGAGVFETTQWSVVLAAGQEGSPQAEKALSILCETYWRPINIFIRSHGYKPEEAEDLTQEFLARCCQKNYWRVADKEKGRFRSFLLASLNYFLKNARRKERADKRGGEIAFVPLNGSDTKQLCPVDPPDPMTPEKQYEQQWAFTLLEQTLGLLEQEYAKSGRGRLLDTLKVYLPGAGEDAASYAEISRRLGLSETAVRQKVFRLRGRFRELLRWAVAQTVGPNAAEVDAELAHLRAVVGS